MCPGILFCHIFLNVCLENGLHIQMCDHFFKEIRKYCKRKCDLKDQSKIWWHLVVWLLIATLWHHPLLPNMNIKWLPNMQKHGKRLI